jgi:hypothetical protein
MPHCSTPTSHPSCQLRRGLSIAPAPNTNCSAPHQHGRRYYCAVRLARTHSGWPRRSHRPAPTAQPVVSRTHDQRPLAPIDRSRASNRTAGWVRRRWRRLGGLDNSSPPDGARRGRLHQRRSHQQCRTAQVKKLATYQTQHREAPPDSGCRPPGGAISRTRGAAPIPLCEIVLDGCEGHCDVIRMEELPVWRTNKALVSVAMWHMWG